MAFCQWDFAIPVSRVLIEVDGCYWHGCEACGYPVPKQKRKEDRRKNTIAKRSGWRLIRIPEHAVKDGSFKELLDGI